jgi:hypothetical protein
MKMGFAGQPQAVASMQAEDVQCKRKLKKEKEMAKKFYLMDNGNLIEEAGRGITKKAINALQQTEWAKKQGGICNIVEYTEPRAIHFARKHLA